MFGIGPATRIYLAAGSTDMRRPLRTGARPAVVRPAERPHLSVLQRTAQPRQHFVQSDSKWVEIAPGIDRTVHSSRLLGRHVSERSCDELGRIGRLTLAGKAPRNAEAGEPKPGRFWGP